MTRITLAKSSKKRKNSTLTVRITRITKDEPIKKTSNLTCYVGEVNNFGKIGNGPIATQCDNGYSYCQVNQFFSVLPNFYLIDVFLFYTKFYFPFKTYFLK